MLATSHRTQAVESTVVVAVSLAIFVVVRLAAIVLVPVAPVFDSLWYFDRAVAISQGLGYVDGGQPTAFWPPGYPAFLGILFTVFGAHVWVGQVANIVLGLAICLLTYRLALATLKDRAGAAFAVALLALYPNQIGYTMGLSTEVFYSFLIVLAVYILSTGTGRIALLGFGAVMGYSTLTKTQTILLPLAIMVLTCRDASWAELRSCARRLVIVYAGVAALVLPWMIRNEVELEHFVLAANGGINLLVGNNPSANGDFTVDDDLVRQAQGTVPRIVGEAEFTADREAQRLALDWIRANPWRAAWLIPKKVWRLWAVDGETEWGFKAGYPDYERFAATFRALRWVNQAYYGVLVLGSIIAVMLLWRRGLLHGLAASGLVIGAYTTLISVVFFGQSRFHHFLIPWVTAYAGWLVAEWWRSIRSAALPAAVAGPQLDR